ncbi:MAG: HK97 gp10 family phage protein [Bacillota bacterium]
MATVQIDKLAGSITLAVWQYTERVSSSIERELDSTSKAVLADIKATSAHRDRTGGYRRGWKRKKETLGGQVKYTIYNKDKPGLVHLLEFGHAKKGGGRVAGRPHVRPVYDAHVPAMETRIEQIIRDGG